MYKSKRLGGGLHRPSNKNTSGEAKKSGEGPAQNGKKAVVGSSVSSVSSARSSPPFEPDSHYIPQSQTRKEPEQGRSAKSKRTSRPSESESEVQEENARKRPKTSMDRGKQKEVSGKKRVEQEPPEEDDEDDHVDIFEASPEQPRRSASPQQTRMKSKSHLRGQRSDFYIESDSETDDEGDVQAKIKKVGKPQNARPRLVESTSPPVISLRPRSDIIVDDSSGVADDYQGGRLGSGILAESSSVSRMEEDEEEDSSGSIPIVATGASTVASPMSSGSGGSRSRAGSRMSTMSRMSRMSRMSSSSQPMSQWSTTSVLDEKEKTDKQDPDWLKFVDYVRNSPASAHERLATDLLDAGVGSATTKSSALLGKLICRSVVDAEEASDSRSKDLNRSCAATIIRSILHMTICNDNHAALVVELINMLYTELRHFPTSVLYSIAKSCLEYMKMDKDREGSLPPRWIEIFGKIVSIMIGKGDIIHETDILDGKAYREHVVAEICRLKWSTDNSASLLAVLREIPDIEDSDLKLILCHVRACVKDIKPSAFPPVVHQLILLAGSRCPLELLSISAEYFKADNVKSELERRQKRSGMGTVVFHFLEAARHCDVLVRAVIKVVKASVFDFGHVMSPFMLSIVMGLTNFEHTKAAIIEPLRHSIMKFFHGMHLTEMGYWYQQAAGSPDDVVTKCFSSILESRSQEQEFMYDGLRELGISLLNAELYQRHYPNTLDRCQFLGSFLIKSLVRTNVDQLPVMMKQLLKLTSSKSIVHTECLSSCLELRTRQIIQPSVIGKTCEIIRHLPMMNCESASLIVKSMSTALQLNYMLLDSLMLILRKTIWKSVESRRTAARIMIILLSNAKVVGDIPNSQYSESQRMLESQQNDTEFQPLDQLPDNQPLCLELLNLCKRCFTQQCEIRKELYLGFHSVVRKNPGICELVCSLLYKHSLEYLSGEDDDVMIEFKKIVEFPVNDPLNQVIIKEDLGFMVQCLSNVVRKSSQAFASIEDGPPASVKQIEDLMKKWVAAALALTPETIEIEAAEAVATAGGSRPLELVHYVETLIAMQSLQVIEAIIEYLGHTGNGREADRDVKNLYEKFKALVPSLQKKKEVATNKKGKGDKNKGKSKANKSKSKDKENSGDGDDISIADTASEVSDSVKFKRPDAPKKIVYFHIFALDNLLNMLRKLYRSGSDKLPFKAVSHTNSEFETMLLETVKQKLAGFKRKEFLHERNQREEKLGEVFVEIAGVIWTCLCNQEYGEDDETQIDAGITQLRLEVIGQITEHLCVSHSAVRIRLIKLFGDETDDVSYENAFPKFFNSWKALQGWMPANPQNEEDRNLHVVLFDILLHFSKPLLPDSLERDQASQVLAWLWNFMASESGKGDEQADFNLAESAISCWLGYYLKSRGFLEQPGQSHHDILSLSQTVRTQLGDNSFVDTQSQLQQAPMWIINEETAPKAVMSILDFIETILDHVTALIGKLKSQQHQDDDLNKKAVDVRERCFSMLHQILIVANNLALSAFPAGGCCFAMLKTITQIFTVMTAMAEYLLEQSKIKADYSLIKGFVKPVNGIGWNFKAIVENGFLIHVEKIQLEHAVSLKAKAAVLASGSKKKKQVVAMPHAAKTQLTQDKKLVPNLVYAMEKYENQISTLAQKLKNVKGTKLIASMKLTNARDFKIDDGKLMQGLNANKARTVRDMTTVPDEESAAVPGTSKQKTQTQKSHRPGPASARKTQTQKSHRPGPLSAKKGQKRNPREETDTDDNNDNDED